MTVDAFEQPALRIAQQHHCHIPVIVNKVKHLGQDRHDGIAFDVGFEIEHTGTLGEGQFNPAFNLFDQIIFEDDLIEQVESWIKLSFPKGTSVFYLETDIEGNPIMPILTEMFNFIYNNRDVTVVLLRNPESRLLERIYSQGRDSILNFALPQDNAANKDRDRYALDYIVSGCIGVIQSWIDRGLDLDPKTMSKITCDLLLQNRSELDKQKTPGLQ